MRSWMTIVWSMLMFVGFQSHGQDFQQVTEVKIFDGGNQLKNAWSGGLNAPQFCEADFNGDGSMDLLVYDKDGNRKQVFIHINGANYLYQPEYSKDLPAINSWVVMNDYNCDGIQDFITHGTGSPKLFQGFYEDGRLKFSLDHEVIYYESSSGFALNLYSVSSHRPIMEDVNGDGDLDVISFDVLLARLVYYENQRNELDIPCDSIYFERKDRCWGNTYDTGIGIITGDTCDFKFARVLDEVNIATTAHPGGTVIALFDEGSDGAYEIIMGDATFANMRYFTNNGSPEVANLIDQDESFPDYDIPVAIDFFPAPYVLDIDKDGDKDLIAAPFKNGSIENSMNVWLYENNGAASDPFRLQKEDFLVGEMLDVGELAAPALFDYNDDGLMDLVVGNGGLYQGGGVYDFTLTLLENTGSATTPSFTIVDENYLDFDVLGVDDLAPAFGDIDNDGDKDLICGEKGGKLIVMDNVDGVLSNPRFLKDNLDADIDIGQSSSPTLFDFNGDDRIDLILGRRDGTLTYYENTGNGNSIEFTWRTDTLGSVVSHPSNSILKYSNAVLGDFDEDGQTDMLLAGADSRIKFYSNIGTDFNTVFNLDSDDFLETEQTKAGIIVNPRVRIAHGDISDDDQVEIFLGLNGGGMHLFSRDLVDTTDVAVRPNALLNGFAIYPNPSAGPLVIQWDERLDLTQPIDIRVFTSIGQEVYRERFEAAPTLQLDLADLPTSIYHIILEQNNSVGSVRWVKY